MPGLAAALALLSAGASLDGPQDARLAFMEAAIGTIADADIIQSRADAADRMTVRVAVDGTGPYDFLIDTGSQRTVLSSATARQMALAPGPRVRVIGMAGSDHVATARVDRLVFGQQMVTGLTVPLLDGQHIGADGIIGTDALDDQRVVFDFVKQTIAIGTPGQLGAASGYEIVVKARRRSGRLILTNAVVDGVRADVVIDTGATGAIGNRALQRALRERNAGVGDVLSVTGHVLPADFGIARVLKLDRLQVSNVLIAFVDSPTFPELKLESRPAIFLGMRELRAFQRIAVDFASRKVLFDLPG